MIGSSFEDGVLAMKDVGLCVEVGTMMLSVPAGMSDEGREQAIGFIRYRISKDAQEQILNGEYSVERDTNYPFQTAIRIDMADMRHQFQLHLFRFFAFQHVVSPCISHYVIRRLPRFSIWFFHVYAKKCPPTRFVDGLSPDVAIRSIEVVSYWLFLLIR